MVLNNLKRKIIGDDPREAKRHASRADIASDLNEPTTNEEGRRSTAAQIEVSVDNLNLDLDTDLNLNAKQQRFREKVDKLAKGTPRFLFRFWSNQSGGDARLNTVDAVTPHRFLGQSGQFECFYKVKPAELGRLAGGHVCGHPIPTAYSSWSQSFPFVLDWAQQVALSNPSVHICILDTAKVDASNVILHTEAASKLFGGQVPIYQQEYLIYGVLSGPAYRAVSIEVFQPNQSAERPYGRFGRLTLTRMVSDSTVQETISEIVKIARTFGGGLEVPIAAHLMAFALSGGSSQKKLLDEICAKLPVPQAWSIDPTIMDPDVNYHGAREAYDADELVRQIVRRKFGLEDPQALQVDADANSQQSLFSAPKAKLNRDPKPTEAEVKKAAKSVTEAARVPDAVKKTYPRMVSDLFITMKGFEQANFQLAKYDEQKV